MPPKTRTITLTGRAPVRINEAEWPIVAAACDRATTGRGALEWQVTLFVVRRNADDSVLVYGTAKGYGCPTERAGALFGAGADLVSAIEEVGHRLAVLTPNQAERIARCVRECVAALPAEVL